MALAKSVALDNGTTAAYWAVASAQYVPSSGIWNVYLGGYVSSDTYSAGKDPLLTRYFVIQKAALGITPEASTLSENEIAIYSAVLSVVNADAADPLNGATTA